ncbi:LuxR family two component transcriptional regulator [Anseongella ginsenosidimutans]|uniref:LuxR family two component transcriptional regulator n=1 Tax=Anseongella ginsenosidimutans TaxID=496056 RepID=A0A4R3KV31_9SPHI|nr:response regulator transcription factor [Anseongella ginsenosidimutans]QEC51603.1 response regulator transcription factor [Anseongella ginsenosidimutans]TCS88931.1 LuxR family two component transcriptional regulator [Anseongella ginsenosidimutans]
MSQDKKVQLAVVEDHPIVIQGLKTLLESMENTELAGSFTTGAGFMDFLKRKEVHIVLLDIILPDVNGIDLCLEIRKTSPETRILVLSNHAERSIIMQTLQNGASGYLLKNSPEEEIISCISDAMNGEIAFSREVKEIIARPGPATFRARPQLTKREKQILKLLGEGKTSAQMAKELFLSPLTVETHRRNLLQKFEVKNVAGLISSAIQQQFL